jgi:hypothetical protein
MNWMVLMALISAVAFILATVIGAVIYQIWLED